MSDQDAPVRLKNRRLVARNRVFSAYLDDLEGPDGCTVRDYLSVVPSGIDAEGVSGVAVLPESDGRLALINVYRHPLGASLWEVPRGFVDPDEQPNDAAVRELKEETGLAVSADRLLPLGIVAPEPGLIAARVRLFVALGCEQTGRPLAAELGHTETRFFTLTQIDEEIAKERIQDPCTLVAYLLYCRHQTAKSSDR